MTLREVVDGQAGLPVPNPTKSYWHQTPSQKLLGHRTTSELPSVADIVVVGSGLSGSFAAHFLKNGKAKDKNVLMLEAREACWGATGRNGGHCQPMVYGSTPNVAAFELETYSFLMNLIAENNIPCHWRTVPGVHVCLTQDVFDAASAAVERLKEHHPELAAQCEVVAPSASAEDERSRRAQGRSTLVSLRVPHAKGAVVQEHAASVWPYKLVSWVLEQLLDKFPTPSFNLQTNTPVTALLREDDGTWLLRTPRGPVRAKTVLLCTNAYTSRLLPAFADLIVPVRGQVAALVPPRGADGAPAQLNHSYVTLGHPNSEEVQNEYLVQRPLPTGEHILGGGRNVADGGAVGVWHDDEIEEPVARWLRTHLTPPLDLRPGDSGQGGSIGTQEELPATFEWTGIMGYSRDHHAYIGAVPESLGGGGEAGGLWVCAGYSGHGMPAAPLSARAVVRLMTRESSTAVDGSVGLPRQFLLTEERVKRARERFETIQERQTHAFSALLSDFAELSAEETD
ncbi:DAO-domain-containing protein [Thozetella sp. PMI_491]|nr:DAO-domain-containing protein [Thozetella sp. PMI_491]